MTCKRCLKQIVDGSAFCSFCGYKQSRQKSQRRGNGSGSAYKRGSTWSCAYIFGYREENGKKIPDKVTKGGFTTKQQALDYIQILKTTPRTKNPDSAATFQRIYERMMQIHQDRVGKTTVDCYKAAYKKFKPIHAHKFKQIGIDDLQSCVDNCGAGKRTQENMKALCTLMYKYAITRNVCTTNVGQYIYTSGEKQTRPAFTLAQIEQIRENGSYAAKITLCMIYTGFRPGELLKLTKSAYHNENGVSYLVGGGKTQAGKDRTVTISPKIAEIISEQLKSDGIYLFPYNGKPMTDDYFRENLFSPLMQKIGITDKNIVPYSCRHTFANLMKGIPGADKDKAALMGHTDSAMTRYYQSSDVESMKAITDAI